MNNRPHQYTAKIEFYLSENNFNSEDVCTVLDYTALSCTCRNATGAG